MSAERLKRITVEEGKSGGRPCIRGRRIRVTDMLELLADYSFLEREDIYAAIECAIHQADFSIAKGEHVSC